MLVRRGILVAVTGDTREWGAGGLEYGERCRGITARDGPANVICDLGRVHRYGHRITVNPAFPDPGGSPPGWVSTSSCELNQGPGVIMIENFRSGLVWRLVGKCESVPEGLRAAGFPCGGLVDTAPHLKVPGR